MYSYTSHQTPLEEQIKLNYTYLNKIFKNLFLLRDKKITFANLMKLSLLRDSKNKLFP